MITKTQWRLLAESDVQSGDRGRVSVGLFRAFHERRPVVPKIRGWLDAERIGHPLAPANQGVDHRPGDRQSPCRPDASRPQQDREFGVLSRDWRRRRACPCRKRRFGLMGAMVIHIRPGRQASKAAYCAEQRLTCSFDPPGSLPFATIRMPSSALVSHAICPAVPAPS